MWGFGFDLDAPLPGGPCDRRHRGRAKGRRKRGSWCGAADRHVTPKMHDEARQNTVKSRGEGDDAEVRRAMEVPSPGRMHKSLQKRAM